MRALIALETLLLAAAAIAAEPKPVGDAPAAELLEFIGDWTIEEQQLIDEAAQPVTQDAEPRSAHSDDAAEETEPIRTGPPR